jgi:hypothetical protein
VIHAVTRDRGHGGAVDRRARPDRRDRGMRSPAGWSRARTPVRPTASAAALWPGCPSRRVSLDLVFPDTPTLADLDQLNVHNTGFDFSPAGPERDHAISEAEWEIRHYPTLQALWASTSAQHRDPGPRRLTRNAAAGRRVTCARVSVAARAAACLCS